ALCGGGARLVRGPARLRGALRPARRRRGRRAGLLRAEAGCQALGRPLLRPREPCVCELRRLAALGQAEAIFRGVCARAAVQDLRHGPVRGRGRGAGRGGGAGRLPAQGGVRPGHSAPPLGRPESGARPAHCAGGRVRRARALGAPCGGGAGPARLAGSSRTRLSLGASPTGLLSSRPGGGPCFQAFSATRRQRLRPVRARGQRHAASRTARAGAGRSLHARGRGGRRLGDRGGALDLPDPVPRRGDRGRGRRLGAGGRPGRLRVQDRHSGGRGLGGLVGWGGSPRSGRGRCDARPRRARAHARLFPPALPLPRGGARGHGAAAPRGAAAHGRGPAQAGQVLPAALHAGGGERGARRARHGGALPGFCAQGPAPALLRRRDQGGG
ncbi:hypothetical protein H632_c3653p0, partial [Helicosporidium sp. ATCC 50920]